MRLGVVLPKSQLTKFFDLIGEAVVDYICGFIRDGLTLQRVMNDTLYLVHFCDN